MASSWSHESAISLLNLLYICIPPELYTKHKQEAYPSDIGNPWPTTNNKNIQDAFQRAATWSNWQYATKIFNYENIMNSTIRDRFLSLTHPNFCKSYNSDHFSQPKEAFHEVVWWVLTKYGISTEFDQYVNNIGVVHLARQQSTIKTLMNANAQQNEILLNSLTGRLILPAR